MKAHMKYSFSLLFAALLCLSGCQAPAAAPGAEPSAPPVIRMSSPLEVTQLRTTESYAGVPASTIPETSVPILTTTEITASESSEPDSEIPYLAGDTTPGWRPELASRYPPDAECSADQLLEKWMAVEGLRLSDLDARSCRQLILTAAQPSDGVETLTVCYERETDGMFHPVSGLDRLQGFVGKNGIMHDRRRNTNTSPAGLWAIGTAFGNEAPPEGLKLPWRQVTTSSEWVCDEASPFFNTWQERGDHDLTPWSEDVERLADYPFHYAWACVIEFNRPPDVIPARGCAIFLHCAARGTGGCVGLFPTDMQDVLRWLDPAKNPWILITGTQKEPQ